MLLNYKELLFDPLYGIYSVDAVLVTNLGTYGFVMIDKTSGLDVGDKDTQVQTIRPAVIFKCSDFFALGGALDELERGAYVTINDTRWDIESYKMKPTPRGERDGEVILLLTGGVNGACAPND